MSESEREELQQLCDEISERQNVDVVIVISMFLPMITGSRKLTIIMIIMVMAGKIMGSLLLVGKDEEGYFVYITTQDMVSIVIQITANI